MIINTNKKGETNETPLNLTNKQYSLDINRQIQFLNHIKNFDGKPDTVDFLVSNYIIMAGIRSSREGVDPIMIYSRK